MIITQSGIRPEAEDTQIFPLDAPILLKPNADILIRSELALNRLWRTDPKFSPARRHASK